MIKFESIGAVICRNSFKSIKNINTLKEEINRKCKGLIDIRNEIQEASFLDYREKINKEITKCIKDISLLEKLERKANNYKVIKVEEESDYDRAVTRIIFPKGTRRSFKLSWLKSNNYPIKTTHYNLSSEYDCTGNIIVQYVIYKANVVEIESLYDL